MTPDQGQSLSRVDAGIIGRQESLPFNGLLFTEREVLPGMRVAIVMEGQSELYSGEETGGKPLVFDVVNGGAPIRKKFYPLPSWKDGEIVNHSGMTGFFPQVRFTPTEVFTSKNAQPGRNYAVFKDGKRVTYDKPRRGRLAQEVVVEVDDQGMHRFINSIGNGQYIVGFNLPEGAVLVPITRPRRLAELSPAEALQIER